MKQFLLFLSLLLSLAVTGQVNVTVNPVGTVCYNDSVAFTAHVTGLGSDTVTSYRWQKNFIDITGAADSVYVIMHVRDSSPGVYQCVVKVKGVDYTSNPVLLVMHPKMNFDIFYRFNPLACPTITEETIVNGKKVKIIKPLCIGQYKTLISGGTQFKNYPPYEYSWGGGFSQDTIVYGLCPGPNTFKVTDSVGCSLDSNFIVDVLKSPKVTFKFLPDSVLYITNPNIQVEFPESFENSIKPWSWDFGDSTFTVENLNPASHSYGEQFLRGRLSDTSKKNVYIKGKILVRLNYKFESQCDTTITNKLTIKVAKLKIANLLLPKGNPQNQRLAVHIEDDKERDYRDAYIGTELLVFDRWGKKVYNKKDYKSEDWDGDNLPDGTYFYILNCTGQFGDEVTKGSITILH